MRKNITVSLGMPGKERVILDGHDITSTVRGISISQSVGDLPTVTLDVLVLDVALDGQEAHIFLPDATRELLERYGWTPPASQGEGLLSDDGTINTHVTLPA